MSQLAETITTFLMLTGRCIVGSLPKIPSTGNRDTLPTSVKTKATEFPQRDGTVLYGIQVMRPIARWVDFTRNGEIDLYTDKQARDDMREYLRKLPDPKKS